MMGAVDVFLVLAVVLLYVRGTLVLGFYRGYFFEKQKNRGKDPRASIKEIFPAIWWLF